MATFTWLPDWTAKKKRSPTVRTVQFGDGYEQRVADGVNISPQSWEGMVFKRDVATVDDIDDFLNARNGIESFNWVTPKGDSVVVKCEEWEVSYDSPGWSTLTCTFKQVFETAEA